MAKKTFKLIKLGAIDLKTNKPSGSFIMVSDIKLKQGRARQGTTMKSKQEKVTELTRRRYDPKQRAHVLWKKIK